MRNQKVKLAIVGATGLVGREMLRVLDERKLPIDEVSLIASERSEGAKIGFRGRELEVTVLRPDLFDMNTYDIVLFAASSGVAAEYAPKAAASGATVIDNSSTFRMEEHVPLIVPEVNPKDIQKAETHGIIANPNCSTIQLVVCLKPLHDAFGLERVVVSTYQSLSGAGQDAMEELRVQSTRLLGGQESRSSHQFAFNCLPHIDVFLEDGHTKEEMKMIQESRKILSLPNLRVAATAVRVATFISHAESLNCEFKRAVSVQAAREILSTSPGISLMDIPEDKVYPTPVSAAGQDEVFVGRIRQDVSVPNGLYLWVVADNLRKGAATNAIQIAELCLEMSFRSLGRV